MRHRSFLFPAILLAIVACGGGGSDTTGPGPSTAANIVAIAGDSQVAPVGTVLPESLAVLVTDTAGHPVVGITIAWAPTGGGSVSPTSSQTNALGIAKTSRHLGPNAGHGKTNAAVTGLTLLQFEAVGQVQGAVQISSNTVSALTDTVLGTLIDPEPRPSVLVVDQHGSPVAGVNVLWTATGGAVTTATVPTDANGISTVGYTFGVSVATAYAAHATVTGLINSPVNFTLAATPGVPTQLVKDVGDLALAAPGSTVLQTVHVTDAHGNDTPGIGIDWAASSGGGSVAPAHDTTGATGRASTTRTLGATAGGQGTTATATSAPGSPTTAFTATAAHIVKVDNNFFNPTTTTIAAGDSVAWQWQGVTSAHNLTFAVTAGAPANAANRTSGVVWRVFTTAGTFSYQCTNHAGMTASITVTP